MLKIFPILLFVSIAFSAEKTFFFLPPDTKSWFDSSPIIVENGDRQSFKEMLAIYPLSKNAPKPFLEFSRSES